MIGDTFEPLKTWHDEETKRVARSLARHIEMKQGGTIVYRKLSKPIHARKSFRAGQ